MPSLQQLQISYLQSIIKEQSPIYFLGTQCTLKFLYTNTCSTGNGAFRFLFTRYFLLIDPINFSILYRKAEVLYGFHDCFAYRIIESYMQAKLMQQNFLFALSSSDNMLLRISHIHTFIQYHLFLLLFYFFFLIICCVWFCLFDWLVLVHVSSKLHGKFKDVPIIQNFCVIN